MFLFLCWLDFLRWILLFFCNNFSASTFFSLSFDGSQVKEVEECNKKLMNKKFIKSRFFVVIFFLQFVYDTFFCRLYRYELRTFFRTFEATKNCSFAALFGCNSFMSKSFEIGTWVYGWVQFSSCCEVTNGKLQMFSDRWLIFFWT